MGEAIVTLGPPPERDRPDPKIWPGEPSPMRPEKATQTGEGGTKQPSQGGGPQGAGPAGARCLFCWNRPP